MICLQILQFLKAIPYKYYLHSIYIYLYKVYYIVTVRCMIYVYIMLFLLLAIGYYDDMHICIICNLYICIITVL